MAEIVLFGASGGIGQYLVGELAGDGRIAGTPCNVAPLNLRPGADSHRVDVTGSATGARFAGPLGAGREPPVLIYTPGIAPNALAHEVSDTDWEQTNAINLTGATIDIDGATLGA